LRGTKLIGAVRLAGKTTQMIKNIVQEKLERGRDFHENLSLATNDWSPRHFTVSRIVDSHEPV